MKKLLIGTLALSAFVANAALACDGEKTTTADASESKPAVAAKAKKTETKAKKEDATLASAGKK